MIGFPANAIYVSTRGQGRSNFPGLNGDSVANRNGANDKRIANHKRIKGPYPDSGKERMLVRVHDPGYSAQE